MIAAETTGSLLDLVLSVTASVILAAAAVLGEVLRRRLKSTEAAVHLDSGATVGQGVGSVLAELESLRVRVDGTEEEIARNGARLDRHGQRLDRLEQGLTRAHDRIDSVADRAHGLGERIAACEALHHQEAS